MKLARVKRTLVMANDVPGLLTSRVEYRIESADASLVWLGPKIDKLEWAKVLAYFKWTYDKCKSEAQVRFFVNVKENRWVAWAFPQKANNGMSAQELDTEEAKKQREQFPDSQWQYLMTVHHHCSCGAFQSGTDERNEHDQDGLHLTIGLIDKHLHDMHARFYLSKNCYDPDMSLFWDIGDVAVQTPQSTHDVIARYQMCLHVEAEFPQQWKDNYIEVKGVYQSETAGLGYFHRGGNPHGRWVNGVYEPYPKTTPQTAEADGKVGTQGQSTSQGIPIVPPLRNGPDVQTMNILRAAEEAVQEMMKAGYTMSELKAIAAENGSFSDPHAYYDVEMMLSHYNIELDDLIREINWQEKRTQGPNDIAKVEDKDVHPGLGMDGHFGYGCGE